MVHRMPCNPPRAQAAALAAVAVLVQRCFGDLAGIQWSAKQWRQAARCFTHAQAAYLASLGASLARCADFDHTFSAATATVQAWLSVMGALQVPSCQQKRFP